MSHRVGLHIGSRSCGIGRALHVIAGVAASASVMAACSSSWDSSGDGAGRGGTESVVTVSVDVVEADAGRRRFVCSWLTEISRWPWIVPASSRLCSPRHLGWTEPSSVGAGPTRRSRISRARVRCASSARTVLWTPHRSRSPGTASVGRSARSIPRRSGSVSRSASSHWAQGALYDDALTVTVVPVIWAEGNYQSDAVFRWLVPATPASGGRLAQATIRLTLTTHSGGVPPGNDAETSRPPSR